MIISPTLIIREKITIWMFMKEEEEEERGEKRSESLLIVPSKDIF